MSSNPLQSDVHFIILPDEVTVDSQIGIPVLTSRWLISLNLRIRAPKKKANRLSAHDNAGWTGTCSCQILTQNFYRVRNPSRSRSPSNRDSDSDTTVLNCLQEKSSPENAFFHLNSAVAATSSWEQFAHRVFSNFFASPVQLRKKQYVYSRPTGMIAVYIFYAMQIC